MIDDLTVVVEDDGLVRYVPRQSLMYSNMIAALIPLVSRIKADLDAGPPAQCFLARDVAELLGAEVLDVCAALVALGYPPRSANMTVEPEEALAVAKRLRPA